MWSRYHLQWRHPHTKFNENPRTGSEVIIGGQTGLFENKLKTMQYYVLYFDLQHKLKVTVNPNGSG
jgi:hypothetical protein